MSGTAVCSGKIKARACVALNIEDAQNIEVILIRIQISFSVR